MCRLDDPEAHSHRTRHWTAITAIIKGQHNQQCFVVLPPGGGVGRDNKLKHDETVIMFVFVCFSERCEEDTQLPED